MAEPTGHEVLTSLLASLKGFAPSDMKVVETPVDEDVPCQVSRCTRPAVFQCSSGYQYCAHHAGVHGEFRERHEFRLVTQARRELFAEAQEILSARIAHPENEDSA